VHRPLLPKHGSKFNPIRGHAKGYIRGLTLNAVRSIESSYGFVRQAKSPNEKASQRFNERLQPLSLDMPFSGSDDSLRDFVPEHVDHILAAEGRLDFESLVEIASLLVPPDVLRAMLVIYYDDLTISEAAKQVGISRTNLYYWFRYLRKSFFFGDIAA
jgi:hypothetical protein